MLGAALTPNTQAQVLTSVKEDSSVLPDAPSPLARQETLSTLSGTVLAINGDAIAGAEVTLAGAQESKERKVLTDANGAFLFNDLAPGRFDLDIVALGMQSDSLSAIEIQPGQSTVLVPILLTVAGTTTNVRVTVSRAEIAQEQVNAAEKQRVLGILPNFYSSYIWDTEPLSARQKFSLAFHSVTDPIEFVGTAITAAAEQANGTFPGYGQGAQGFGKRYGAAYADDALGRIIESAVLPSLLHQDPRYFYKGSGSFGSRVLYAMSRAVITRGDNARAQPNYSHILGSVAVGGISSLYHPAGSRGVGLTFRIGIIDTAGNAANNLVREFVLRGLTPSVPTFETGKP